MSTMTLLVATTALVGAGQAPAPAPQGRERAIWDFAQSRLNQQADIWFEVGDFPKVVQLLRVERDTFPHDYEVATNLGWMQENVQDYPGATASYERYLKDNPKDPDAPLPLAQLYFRQKKYAQVPPLLEPVLGRTPPPHGNVWRILAHSYERTQRLKESRRVWQRYLKVAPNDAPAKVNLARVEKKIAAER
jgi:tetratricopeptide (TPR) repeat protein